MRPFDYICALFVNMLLIVGIWKVLQRDMLLGEAGDWLYLKLGDFWSKPLFICPPCMSSIWGTAFFFGSRLCLHLPWWSLPLHVLALCGLTTLAMMLEKSDE